MGDLATSNALRLAVLLSSPLLNKLSGILGCWGTRAHGKNGPELILFKTSAIRGASSLASFSSNASGGASTAQCPRVIRYWCSPSPRTLQTEGLSIDHAAPLYRTNGVIIASRHSQSDEVAHSVNLRRSPNGHRPAETQSTSAPKGTWKSRRLRTFELPALRDRLEDIELDLDYELDRFAEREGNRVSFNQEPGAHFSASRLRQMRFGRAISATSRQMSRGWQRLPHPGGSTST